MIFKTFFPKVGSRINLDSMLTYVEHMIFFEMFGSWEFVDVAKKMMADLTSVTSNQWLRMEKVMNKTKINKLS